MNLQLPEIATKKFETVGNPELTDENKRMLHELIKRSENQNGDPARIKFSLIEGTCKIYGNWKKVNEFTKAAVSIEVADINSQQTFTSYSEVFYDINTLGAGENSVLKAYNIALKNATHQSLIQLSNK